MQFQRDSLQRRLNRSDELFRQIQEELAFSIADRNKLRIEWAGVKRELADTRAELADTRAELADTKTNSAGMMTRISSLETVVDEHRHQLQHVEGTFKELWSTGKKLHLWTQRPENQKVKNNKPIGSKNIHLLHAFVGGFDEALSKHFPGDVAGLPPWAPPMDVDRD